MTSFGRSKKETNGGIFECFDDTPRPSGASQVTMELTHGGHSIGYVDHSVDLEKCYFSDSSLFHSSLFQEFNSSRMPSPKVQPRRADMFLLEDQNRTEMDSSATSQSRRSSPSFISMDSDTPKLSVDLVPGWPLMHHTIGSDKTTPTLSLDQKMFSPSPQHRLSVDSQKSALGSLHRRFSEILKPVKDPVLQSPSDQEITVSSRISYDRHMSVVDWALQLPHRNRDLTKSPERFTEEDYMKMLGEIARDAFRAGSADMKKGSAQMSVKDGAHRANKKVKFSLEEPKTREASKLDSLEGGKMSLAQRLDILCLDRKCEAFVYDELEAATSNFSPSKSL